MEAVGRADVQPGGCLLDLSDNIPTDRLPRLVNEEDIVAISQKVHYFKLHSIYVGPATRKLLQETIADKWASLRAESEQLSSQECAMIKVPFLFPSFIPYVAKL